MYCIVISCSSLLFSWVTSKGKRTKPITSLTKSLWFSCCLVFMVLTRAASIKNLRSASTRSNILSDSYLVSFFCTALIVMRFKAALNPVFNSNVSVAAIYLLKVFLLVDNDFCSSGTWDGSEGCSLTDWTFLNSGTKSFESACFYTIILCSIIAKLIKLTFSSFCSRPVSL